MSERSTTSEWTTTAHVERYRARADTLPHRREGEAVLLELVSPTVQRVLDLGTGDGRLLDLVTRERPEASGVAIDLSAPMLAAARERFAGEDVEVLEHDLASPLPELGRFDLVVSSFAIHHVEHERKRALYGEVFALLASGGLFCNLEHVASPTQNLHRDFYQALGYERDWEDPSNRLLDVESQLRWLSELGFEDVDCYWKWREMALLAGRRPEADLAPPGLGTDA